jgi:hypothetical protein
MKWKDCDRKRWWSNLKYYTDICLEGLRRTTKNLIQDSQSQGRDLNLRLLEYEAGMSISRPRRSVRRFFLFELSKDGKGIFREKLYF